MTLLTYDQVADELAVCRRTVENLVADGQLTAVALRGARRVRHEDLDGFVAALPKVRNAAAPAVRAHRPRARRELSFREKLRSVA